MVCKNVFELGDTVQSTNVACLQDIEQRLKQSIPSVADDLSLPPEVMKRMKATAAGGAGYGEQKSSTRNKVGAFLIQN